MVGLNEGTRTIHRIRSNRLIRVYHVSGELGTSTENNFKDSLIIARANYSHVWPVKMSSVLSSMQVSHQKKMFELCGVHIQSNAAYEIATKGLIRPTNDTVPVVYGIKCVQFDRPKFTVEVHAINEHVKYLGQLIQVKLRNFFWLNFLKKLVDTIDSFHSKIIAKYLRRRQTALISRSISFGNID